MGTKRANGEASIYKRTDGRWAASLSLDHRRRKTFYGKTRQEVARKLAAALKSRREGRAPIFLLVLLPLRQQRRHLPPAVVFLALQPSQVDRCHCQGTVVQEAADVLSHEPSAPRADAIVQHLRFVIAVVAPPEPNLKSVEIATPRYQLFVL